MLFSRNICYARPCSVRLLCFAAFLSCFERPTRKSSNRTEPNIASCLKVNQTWKWTSKTRSPKTAYLRGFFTTNVKQRSKLLRVPYTLPKFVELWPTNEIRMRVLTRCYDQLLECSHAGHRMRFKQTLPRIRKWATLLKMHVENLWGSFSLKRGPQNCLFSGGFTTTLWLKVNIFGTRYQWRHGVGVAGGGGRTVPGDTIQVWHPDESPKFLRLNFTKGTGETITWKADTVVVVTKRLLPMTKKVVSFLMKK